MKSTLALVLVCLLSLAAGFTFMGERLKQGEEALIQRRYEDAVRHLEAALVEETEGRRDRVLLLLGRAQGLAGHPDRAVATYQRLIDGHLGSPLLHKAQFQQADARVASGDYEAAALVYREQIERLVGLSRKEEVAETYLGLAEKALGKEPRDPARAVAFFDLALDLGLSPGKALSVRLEAAAARLLEGNASDAVSRFTPLVDELEVGNGKLRAMLGLGRARLLAGDRAGARRVLRDLTALAPEHDEAPDAAFEIARTYGVPTPNPVELDRAVAALHALAEGYPTHAKARVAMFVVAQCYRHVGRTEESLAALRRFLEQSGDLEVEEVAQARAMVGDVLAAQEKLEDAITAWRGYLQAHPAHRDWERVQRAIVDAEYQLAQLAFETGEERFAEARERYEAFALAHPLDDRNPDVLLAFGEMLFVEKKFSEARDAYKRCVSKYPGKEAASRAQFRVGEIYETKTFNYLNALRSYKKVTWGSWAPHAQMRIVELEHKSLSLLTPRTYRTGEAPVFKLTSRNIETVRVRVFKLDLETYFRSTHMSGGVEGLDIEVIEPDQVFESSVPEYQKYRETERDVDIVFRDAGAYVVKVDDSEFEATTLVLVTDVALIAKTSRHELFVFTQNVKENRPEGGMKVVLSDGEKAVAEGTTDSGGVWRFKGKELQTLDAMRVFAINAAGSGAGSLDLSGLGYSAGLSAKGYLFTDRPAYQPGQTVHVKGIVREVSGGLYRLPVQEGYRLQILSASGRLMLQRDVDFTDFGTFAADLALPPQASLGEWRIRVDRHPAGGTDFSGSFRVARYERPRLTLTAELDRPVVYRGEKIEGKFALRYFFGEPAIGKPVEYRMALPDGSVVERVGVTNAVGEVPFSLETTEFAEEAMARVEARVVMENVATQVIVPVVTTEFAPAVSLVRSVYLSGEPFDAVVEIVDRSGKPLGRKGTARLLRYETTGKGGHRVEVEVSKSSFETSSADGRTTLKFRAKKGGNYVVRVEAKDRFGTVVTDETGVLISGDDDEVKLRLLSDRQHYRVGETVRVKVANRAGPRLVLRTLQGDGVLAYETMVLPGGESEQELKLTTLHAPNFGLAMSMIDGTELHLAQREFVVERDLTLTVKSAVSVARPGDEIEVEVKATDPEGRPVRAEVALSLVDGALLSVYPDETPEVGAFFYGMQRETEFRTISSCTWSYSGPSRRVSADLLAEERRVEATKEDKPGGQPLTGGDDFFAEYGRGSVEAPTREQAQVITGSVRGRFGGRDGRGPASPGRALGLARGPADVVTRSAQGAQLYFGAAQQFDEIQQRGFIGRGLYGFNPEGMLNDAGLNEPRSDFSELGGWVSSALTDKSGVAVVKLKLPDSTTAWTIQARGVTTDTYVGQGEAGFRTSMDLQASLVAPRSLTEGDRTELTVRAHNLTDRDRQVDLGMTTRVGDEVHEHSQQVKLGGHREGEASFALQANSARSVAVSVTASSGGLSDRVERNISVRPFGMEYRSGRTGRTGQDASFRLSLPPGRDYTSLNMSIEVGPDPGGDLVAAATGSGYRPWNCRRIDSTHLSLASRGLSALRVLGYLERAGRSLPADAARLRGVAQATLSRLVNSQRPDGSFSWIGSAASDVRTTAQAVLFLGAAKKQGMPQAEQALDSAVEWLLKSLRGLRGEPRVQAVHALTEVGRGQFEVLNALHRAKAKFGLSGLARLALAWQHEGRGGLSKEVLAVLRPKLTLTGAADAARIEAVGLAAAALLVDSANDVTAKQAITWLQGQRRGASFGTTEATAAALRALTTAGGAEVAAGARADIRVTVNGTEVAVLGRDSVAALTGVEVPVELLEVSDNEVALSVRGRGVAYYAATLTGFGKGFREEDKRSDLLYVRRQYLPALRRHAGVALQPGFAVVRGRFDEFENQMSELEAGKTGRVRTYFTLHEAYREAMTPLVVEEPIPAGCSVPRESVQGNFDHVVVEPDRITCYYRRGRYSDRIEYELHGRFPGKYRALPTRFYGAERPDLLAHGPVMPLVVNPHGVESQDGYRMTPDELYLLGKGLFDEGALDKAGDQLGSLLDEWQKDKHQLNDGVFKDVARMMLFVSVARNDSRGIVRFFEEVKDRYEELVIPFDKVVAVGKAYLDLGEFERALMVFRGTAEASFLKEVAVAKTLQDLGEVRASVSFLRRLLLSYPDINTIRQSLYGVGQKLAAQAAQMSPSSPVDARVGTARELRELAVRALREFIVLYPDDPLAEEVSFAWATTHVEGGDLKAAKRVAEAALERYPGSMFEDELLYTVGFVDFALGSDKEAFTLLERVATEEFKAADGTRRLSDNKDGAIYLQGQIHHARGEAAKALELYEKVKDEFSDADEASEYFTRKALSLAEVTTFGLESSVVLPVKYRNLSELEIKVYRVDLMRLYLLEKSLNNIRNILLHGIRPYAEQRVKLGDGKDYADMERKLTLDLVDPGAYLVVARGESLLATGMVLRSDLAIEAQEQTDVGRIRVNVKKGGDFLSKAHVKVVGSGDERFRSGDTDLRGIFVADQLVGRATVIVKKGDEYAFYRGKGIHQADQYRPKPTKAPAPKQQRKSKGKQFKGWNNNVNYNMDNRMKQVRWLEQVMNKQQDGVEVYRTK